jgi:imidazolonepropionase-like amidohydrolase
MSPELMREAFAIAHHHGKRCMVHAVCKDSIVNSLDAGVDSIEHGVMLDEVTAERMAREEVFLVPTLSGWRERCNDWGRDAGHVRHAELMRPHHDRSVRIACSIGLKMAYGSDNFGNLADEVRGLHDAGLSLSECLVVATRNGAELLGIQDKVGTIEKGKQADMVVLGKDPLGSFEAYRDIRLVFRDGRKIDPTLLPI